MAILVLIAHQGHQFASLVHCIVELTVDISRLLHQVRLLFVKVGSVTGSHEICITRLVLDLGNLILRILDVSLILPVLHDLHEELAVVSFPMLKSAPNDPLFVIVAGCPVFPHLERTGSALEIGTSKGV